MEELKNLLFALYSNYETKEECLNLTLQINKEVFDTKRQRINELKKGK